MSNLQARDEVPWDYAAQAQLGYNPSGLDPEGMVRTAKGEFWLVEEYGPSVCSRSARTAGCSSDLVP